MMDIKFRYMFSATQRRSFDLHARGDWSRYLNVAPRGGAQVLFVPGINLFTLNCTVKPRAVLDVWMALHHQWRQRWHFELGYDFWYRVSEQVKDPCGFEERYGFFKTAFSCLEDEEHTVSCTTINSDCKARSCISTLQEVNPTDADLQVLGVGDLDMCNVGHPRAFTHTIYGVFAYDGMVCERPVTFGLGGSYEIPQDKKYALEQWAFWGTITLAL